MKALQRIACLKVKSDVKFAAREKREEKRVTKIYVYNVISQTTTDMLKGVTTKFPRKFACRKCKKEYWRGSGAEKRLCKEVKTVSSNIHVTE